jgi:hypothetical protein
VPVNPYKKPNLLPSSKVGVLIVLAVWWQFFAALGAAPDSGDVIQEAALRPTGKRYRAVVPDTLDLAERSRLSVHGLTSFLNEKANYGPYGHTYFDANPPYMSDLPGGPPNWGKIGESLLMARAMCGSTENLKIEAATLRGMLSLPVLLPDGKSYAYARDYLVVNPAAPTPLSRSMLALMALQQMAPNPELRALIDRMAQDHVRAAQRKSGGLFYSDPAPATGDTRIGVLGNGFTVFVNGCAIRALCRWSDLSGDRSYLEAAGGLARFALEERFWKPEAGPKAVMAAERGHFSGHTHSYTQFLMGLLCYAIATNDAQLKEFVRSSYEYIRSFGIARIGNFGEGCATGDMTYLALKLSDSGVGDYWDDADRYVRNHLAELQITDAAKLRQATDLMPPARGRWDTAKGSLDPLSETADRVVERNVGIFFSDATHPALIPDHSMMVTVCCTGNCTPAMYCAWESIVRCADGAAQINLFLNRASPWLDVDSYLPYEGKLVVHNKTARKLSVRIPGWVEMAKVRAFINDRAANPFHAGRYLVFERIATNAEIRLAFPVTETTEAHSFAWKQSDFWQECTNPGASWKPAKKPNRYVCRFRGNTLMDISPREEGLGYSLYQREFMRRTNAPVKTVERYFAPELPRW